MLRLVRAARGTASATGSSCASDRRERRCMRARTDTHGNLGVLEAENYGGIASVARSLAMTYAGDVRGNG